MAGAAAFGSGAAPTSAEAAPVAPDARPNIVVVMLDDFSMDLVQTMRSVQKMRRAGASYPHSFVTDSLCCVSRSSFFTGQYPHQTGVLTNTSNDGQSTLGGWAAYAANRNPERAFNVRLQESGYTTGFVGKFLNEYEWSPGRELPPVVPGWSTFNTVFGSAYDGWDFASTSVVDGRMRLVQHDAPPASASGMFLTTTTPWSRPKPKAPSGPTAAMRSSSLVRPLASPWADRFRHDRIATARNPMPSTTLRTSMPSSASSASASTAA